MGPNEDRQTLKNLEQEQTHDRLTQENSLVRRRIRHLLGKNFRPAGLTWILRSIPTYKID
jgi:hypothetical protein